jgi:hypothetical protein
MARTGTPTITNDACAALPLGSLAGKVVLIRRGTCPFYMKAFNAQSAGAAGALFTLQGDDVPFTLVHLDHQSRELKLEVFDVATGSSLGFAEIDDFVVRNSTAILCASRGTVQQ